MNISETCDYLVRARRDLWATLENVPDEILSRPSMGGERFHCIKNLVFHTAGIEDSYLATLSDDELRRMMSPHDAPEQRFTVDSLLWHVDDSRDAAHRTDCRTPADAGRQAAFSRSEVLPAVHLSGSRRFSVRPAPLLQTQFG